MSFTTLFDTRSQPVDDRQTYILNDQRDSEMNQESQPLQSLDEQIESRVQAIRVDRNWWPCRRGCDACCRQLAHPPELSAPEWARVDAAVASLPAPIQAVIEQSIDVLLLQIVEQTLSAAVICPYLDKHEGVCRIYASRPLACRTYGFFVARDHDQYCDQIETEVNERSDATIVWGNAEALHHRIEQLSGAPISFAKHYHDRPCINQHSSSR